MKILWLASWYPNPYEPYNGDFIQRHAEAVAEFLLVDVIHVLQTGHLVEIKNEEALTYKRGALTEYIYAFKFTPRFGWLDKLRYNILYHRYYKKIIQQYFKTNGKPDIVHVHVPVKAGLIAIELLKQYNIPFIVSEQSSHYEERSPDYFFKRSKYFQRNTKNIFEQANFVTNVSATIGEKLKSLFNIKNYCTIHNLVDTNIFSYKQRRRDEKLRFLHVSSMNEQKNPQGILQALAAFDKVNKNWECVFCGPLKNGLQTLAASFKLDSKIHFTGEIPYTEVATQMQEGDIFILFSNHENFPCVVVEALCCGLPVISTNAGGVKEAINEHNGIVIEVGNINQLTNALIQLTQNLNAYKKEEISINAQALYNKKVIAKQFIEIYKELLSKTAEKQQRK